MVAVALRLAASSPPARLEFDPPPQHSPIFGQRASSQTVCKPKPRKSFLILLNEEPVGILVFRYDGKRGLW